MGCYVKVRVSLAPRPFRNQTAYTEGDRIASCHTRKKYEITELGIMHPEEVPTTQLLPGQVGYIACNMRQSSEGEILSHVRKITLTWRAQHTLATRCTVSGILSNRCLVFSQPRPWYVLSSDRMRVLPRRPSRQVFAGIYPMESNDFPKLEESIKRVQWFVKANRT